MKKKPISRYCFDQNNSKDVECVRSSSKFTLQKQDSIYRLINKKTSVYVDLKKDDVEDLVLWDYTVFHSEARKLLKDKTERFKWKELTLKKLQWR